MGFDIDACCVGFDGKRVLALPRCVRSLRSRTILVDLDRRSLTYEKRLIKYSQRGFLICVGGFRFADLDTQHFAKQPRWALKGLGKILKVSNRNSWNYAWFDIFDIVDLQKSLRETADSGTQMLGSGNDGDYGFIPYWGGYVTQQALDELKKEGTTSFPLKDGSVAKLSNVCSDDVELDLTWITQDPGRQVMTGSFHPVSGGDWGEQHRWNRNHLPPPEDADGFLQHAPDANRKSSLTSLFNRRRFFYTYLLGVRARSIINVVLLPAPNSFAAEAILPYLLDEDVGRFAMATTSEKNLVFPGKDIAQLIKKRLESSHQDSVNPALIDHLERNSAAAVIAGQANPIHNPVLASLIRVYASVCQSKLQADPDTVFPADTKSLLLGLVDELMYNCKTESNRRWQDRDLLASSSFIGKLFKSLTYYSRPDSELSLFPSGTKWHPKVVTSMPSMQNSLSQPGAYTAQAKRDRYTKQTERPILSAAGGKSSSSYNFEFSEHLFRIYFQQQSVTQEQLSNGGVTEIYEDLIGSGEAAFIPSAGVEQQKYLQYTYLIEKLLRQIFHIALDNVEFERPLADSIKTVVLVPADIFRAISSDRLLWCVFSQCVFPSTGMLPKGLRTDCLQHSRRLLSEGIIDMTTWNSNRSMRNSAMHFQLESIKLLIEKMDKKVKQGQRANQLKFMTNDLHEKMKYLASLEKKGTESQVASILEWVEDLKCRLQQDTGQEMEERQEMEEMEEMEDVEADVLLSSLYFVGKHYVSAERVHSLAGAIGILLPKQLDACTPILAAVDEFIVSAVEEAISIAKVAQRSGDSVLEISVTHTTASLRLITSADETSQMRPVGFTDTSKEHGKSRGILEMWMSREIGGALMAGRAAGGRR